MHTEFTQSATTLLVLRSAHSPTVLQIVTKTLNLKGLGEHSEDTDNCILAKAVIGVMYSCDPSFTVCYDAQCLHTLDIPPVLTLQEATTVTVPFNPPPIDEGNVLYIITTHKDNTNDCKVGITKNFNKRITWFRQRAKCTSICLLMYTSLHRLMEGIIKDMFGHCRIDEVLLLPYVHVANVAVALAAALDPNARIVNAKNVAVRQHNYAASKKGRGTSNDNCLACYTNESRRSRAKFDLEFLNTTPWHIFATTINDTCNE